MALGLILRVSWISFLLFDRSAGIPTERGYGYPYKEDSHNIGDDGEDEALTSPTFDESDWQASNNQPTGPVYTSYNKPAVAQWPGSVTSQHNPPYTASAREVEKLTNGAARDWGWDNPEQLLLFPLNPNYQPSDPAEPQPGQPQSTSLGVPASPAGGSILSSPAGADEPAPSSTSQAAGSPNSESWQPVPVSSGYGVADYPNQDLNSGSTGGGSSSTPHLVYEDVFQYPPENTGASSNTAGGYSQGYPMSKGSSTASTPEGPSLPSNPTNEGAQPVHPSSSGGEPLNLGQTDHQPREENPSPIPQTPAVSTQDVQVTQRLSEPIRPPPPPPSPSPPPLPRYFIQSRNGYQRARYLFSKSRYSPEFVSS
ncbi:leucine-rich repeat extensin-like protein 5 [Sebastes umbrosus]|uniref:leucine-rich repeat extensin-like protein 5 n=1 Tax=Sebastes umbrosus TaxID=72105 RepID=UPI0018A04FCC|nr:leucine-rich repeat extensin-like protein 5 [Sebastes umbrosus]